MFGFGFRRCDEPPMGLWYAMPRGRGGGPGWGGGWGWGGRGGPGGGMGRVFGPGDLRLILLDMVREKPRHGYELIKELEQKFSGAYAPSPGSIYPTFTLLEELGYVSATVSRGARRLYTITPEGILHLEENAAALQSARAQMERAAMGMAGRSAHWDFPPEALRHAIHELRAALFHHAGGWDEAEVQRVRKILQEAAQAISKRPDHD